MSLRECVQFFSTYNMHCEQDPPFGQSHQVIRPTIIPYNNRVVKKQPWWGLTNPLKICYFLLDMI